MPHETFTAPKPVTNGTGYTNKIRANVNEFGDGYAQVIRTGINTHEQEVTLTWAWLSAADADAIEAFLLARNGESFSYTLPSENTAKLWRCLEWTTHYVEKGGRSITAKFKRTYS